MNRYENYYEKDGNYLKDINHDDSEHISPIPISAGYISPGDVLSFLYPGSGRVFVFVVSVKRGAGVFYSNSGNLLLACFKLTSTSPQISSNVIKTLYKNRQFASYYTVSKGLKAIFGPNSFRTYNLKNVTDLNEISIDKNRLPSIDDTDDE
jgi:hypothetical protein